MAIRYTQMRTSEIKNWESSDCQQWLNYMHQANEGMVLLTNRHMLTITPTGDWTGFIVDLNNGTPARVYSNSATRRNILDAIACDHHGRIEREIREFNRAVTGRFDGRDNFGDKIDRGIASVIDAIFR
jgi:hypothetical protein